MFAGAKRGAGVYAVRATFYLFWLLTSGFRILHLLQITEDQILWSQQLSIESVVDAGNGFSRFWPETTTGFRFRVAFAFVIRSIFDRDRDTSDFTIAATVTIDTARKIKTTKNSTLSKRISFILVPPLYS